MDDNNDLEGYEWALRLVAYKAIEEAGGEIVITEQDLATIDLSTRLGVRLNDDGDFVISHHHVTTEETGDAGAN